MNTPVNAVPEFPDDSQATATPAMTPTRPVYWSVRRELWENRSLYLAPLIVAAVFLFGFLVSMIHLRERSRDLSLLGPAQQRAAMEQPYDILAMLLILTVVLVGVFYCLDALHGERRDRSILFWKSLPVSDLTTVLSKASIPIVILPLLTFAIIVATQLIMLLLSIAIVPIDGLATSAWIPFFQRSLALLYGLIVIALWHAPLYGWLLLVSGWARRTTFLWAVLPPIALCIVEKIAFNTSHLASLLKYRLFGFSAEAFAFDANGATHGAVDSLSQLTPGKFLGSPGLWIGLAFAAAFLAVAVRLRRDRSPI